MWLAVDLWREPTDNFPLRLTVQQFEALLYQLRHFTSLQKIYLLTCGNHVFLCVHSRELFTCERYISIYFTQCHQLEGFGFHPRSFPFLKVLSHRSQCAWVTVHSRVKFFFLKVCVQTAVGYAFIFSILNVYKWGPRTRKNQKLNKGTAMALTPALGVNKKR